MTDISPATQPPADGAAPIADSSLDGESPPRPAPGTVLYKGAPLEAERGPGLGCFYSQLIVLAIAVVITPLSVVWGWPEGVSAALLILVLLLLLLTGQTVIFLLRLVAADRRAAGRRRPLASTTRTVGELEDERAGALATPVGESTVRPDEPPASPSAAGGEDSRPSA